MIIVRRFLNAPVTPRAKFYRNSVTYWYLVLFDQINFNSQQTSSLSFAVYK